MTAERLPWICEDPASLRLLEIARKAAAATATLLITGESGAGKNYLSRLIHELSPRCDAPFLKVDCANLPPELVESELFGHERGAFTGAVDRKAGSFELAGNGTLVLDEVVALPLRAQSKILRVLQEQRFERQGGTETVGANSRVVALTSADLEAAITAGRFREDLFFRLKLQAIHVPPLRERVADIVPLADFLLASLRTIHGHPGAQLSDSSKRMLAAYSWPGNIRELRDALQRALMLSRKDALEPDIFPEYVVSAASTRTMPLRSLEDVEKEVIAGTLEALNHRISQTAEILGISRKTLLEKRKKYGLK
jgi:two-component system, NtrC family, response regulator AtoC